MPTATKDERHDRVLMSQSARRHKHGAESNTSHDDAVISPRRARNQRPPSTSGTGPPLTPAPITTPKSKYNCQTLLNL
jgi:hypothetical protein